MRTGSCWTRVAVVSWLLVAVSGLLPISVALAQEAAGAEAQTPGVITGTIIDKSTGDPVIEAGVEVLGAAKRVKTDLDGKFRVRVPPGTYEVRVFAPDYRGVRIQRLIVQSNQESIADAALEPLGKGVVETVEVFGTPAKSTEVAQLAKRKSDVVASETISREAMRKTTGAGAADIVRRLPGVIVVEDRYPVVRGLGNRYVGALLNDNRLPSPDPFRRAVPLDLFPVNFLDNLAVLKTYSPAFPGDFVAGIIALELRDFPSKLTYDLGVNTGFNFPQTTGRDFLTYPGSPGDYVTLGTRFRDPPKDLPPFSVAELPDKRRFAVGRSFKDIWSFQTDQAPPNWGANVSIGNRWGPFGFQLGGLYSTEFRQLNDAVQRQYRNPAGTNGGSEVEVIDSFHYDEGRFLARLGGVLTTAYELNDKNRFNFRALVNRFADDRTRVDFGKTESQRDPALKPPAFTRQWFLRWVQEQLALGQLSGEHDFDWIRLDWRSALSRTTRNEPDTRYSTYQGPLDDLTFSTDSLGGTRITNVTRQELSDSMADFTVPFNTALPFTDVWQGLPAKFKFGAAYAYRKLRFSQRRFLFVPDNATQNTTKPPEELFAPDQLGPALADFTEGTQPSDAFNGSQQIIGGYGLFELPIVRDRLLVQGGARLEYSFIQLNTGLTNTLINGQPVCPGVDLAVDCFAKFDLLNVDPLPAVNIVYHPRSDMNIRASWSQSVSRPEFRELAPAEFPAQRGQRSQFGNPLLVEAQITNWDARWEWFLSPLELVSLSFFYKKLQNPIEKTAILAGPEIAETWLNAESATIKGFEFEARKNLGFLQSRLAPFTFEMNATYIDSSVTIPQQKIFGLPTQQTVSERRLQDAAPYIINASIEYAKPDLFTARLLYLTFGPTITAVGSVGVPNTILERRNQLDAVVLIPMQRWIGQNVNMRLTAENLLNDPVVFTVGGKVQQRFAAGVKFGIGLSYSY
jgi:hypothetical protein